MKGPVGAAMRARIGEHPGLWSARRVLGLSWPLLIGLLLLAQHAIAVAPATVAHPLTLFARLGDLVLVGLALLLAHAAGAWLMRRLALASAPVEGAAYATALGLGVGAYACLALGFVGLYRPPVLLGAAASAGLLLRNDLAATWAGLARWVRAHRRDNSPAARGAATRALAALLLLTFGVALLGALTAPHHFDPLAYHLAAPQRFLQTGRIAPTPDILFGNLPLTAELLYGVGLAFGSAAFGQLLHLAFAILTGAALWALARRYYDGVTAWLALALFLGTPLVAVWSRVADIDLALSCFVLLALGATLRAGDAATAGEARRWLALAGIFGGLALGTKYQALFVMPLLGLLVLLERLRTRGPRAAVADAAVYCAAALAVAAPWYLKNWIALGNPLWPLFIGGRWYDRQAVELTAYFAHGMAISPRTPGGYLALPLRAYLVGDIEQRLVILNPLFLLLPALALSRRRALAWRPLGYCGLLSAGLAIGWALGFQELRYLLPICAPLSLATAIVLRAALDRPRIGLLVRPALLSAALLSLLLTFFHVGADRPIAVLLGRESLDDYLRRSITTGASYRATQFLAGRLGPGETVLFFNEAQIFYVPFAARTDQLDTALLTLTEAHPDPAAALAALQAERVDYLLVNEANIRYRRRFDPEGRLERGKAAFERLAPLLEPVYRDGPAERPTIVIYRVPRGVSVHPITDPLP